MKIFSLARESLENSSLRSQIEKPCEREKIVRKVLAERVIIVFSLMDFQILTKTKLIHTTSET